MCTEPPLFMIKTKKPAKEAGFLKDCIGMIKPIVVIFLPVLFEPLPHFAY